MPPERPRGRRIKEPTPPAPTAEPATYPGVAPSTGSFAPPTPVQVAAPAPPIYFAPLDDAVPVLEIQPLDVDGVRTVAVGTGLWALALVALLPFYGWLADTGRVWWIWTCFAGIGLGLLGIAYCTSRRDRAAELERELSAQASTGRRRR